MFTGIVTHLGTVVALEHDAAADTALLTLDAGGALDGLPAGGSLAVDGVCLTALDEPTERPGVFRADLMGQTLRMTSLGDRAPGDRVNLEVDVMAKYVARYVEGYVSRYLRERARLGEER